MAGVYIHVPFCITKCPYCDFYSMVGTRQIDGFVTALCREIELRAYELEGEVVETIYFGGGTPSLLDGWQVQLILHTLAEHLTVSDSPEVTLECNPGDLSLLHLRQCLDAGVNRFSIGAQSFDPQVLKFLKRRHAPSETSDMYYTLRQLGSTNISLDLMYGIPGTNLGTVLGDLDQLLTLRPEHISTYHLIYEEGTPLYHQLKMKEIEEIPEELSLEMYHLIVKTLTDAGYEHYEISNFALPSYHSKHNSSYWYGTPYLGLGPSAHSYIHPWRSSNIASVKTYNDSLFQGARFLNRSYEYITPEIAYEEYILTHLRTSKGISEKEIEKLFGKGKVQELQPKVGDYIHRQLLTKEGTRYRLTEQGIDLSDSIMADLI
ncbi:MAG: radical SAM family heme chaperone HemW [Porphyromonas sp.]|nr:radical SAM family heme chaperone HemW [Porphyromonas sp.]